MNKPRLFKNLPPFLLLAGALLIARPASAQNLYVGSNSSGQTTNFTSGTNTYDNIYVGYNAGDSNNTLSVANTNTAVYSALYAWYNSPLIIGYDGSGNRMVITNGATVSGGASLTGYIGYNSDALSNSVLVTGTNSLWYNPQTLLVGQAGSSSSLVITNGGQVDGGLSVIIGNLSSSSNNSVLVTGAGSLLSAGVGGLSIGGSGSGTLTVASGATVSAPSIGIATGTLNVGVLGGSDTNVSLLTQTISLGNSASALNFNQKDAFTLTSSISGYSGTLNQLGSGTTILSGNNSYSGGTTISAGTLQTTSTNALGASHVSLTGGTLSLQTNLTMYSLVWDSSAQITLSNLTNGVYLNDTSALTLTGSGTNVFNLIGYTYTPLPSSNIATPFELLSWGVGNSYTANNFSVNGATNYTLSINQNSLWFQQNYSDLFVGSNSSVASTNFTSGTNYFANIYVGYTTAASNNLLTLSNAGTTLANSAALYVGDNGASNRMVISGGAVLLTTSNSTIGNTVTSSNNSVLVTGAGSTWSNNANLIIGSDSSGNSLAISNGGAVLTTSNTTIGFSATSSNNSVLVTASGSTLSNNANLIVGSDGSGNSLVISNGGSVSVSVMGASNGTVIGMNSDASNNSLIVTGTNSILSNASITFVVGNAGSGNSMVISNGAQLVGGHDFSNGLDYGAVTIGNTVTSSSNSVLVTGSGSTWRNITYIFVGVSGSGNSLVISNGAQVENYAGYIGEWATASNNSVLVTGSGSTWSNSSFLDIGQRGGGNRLVISNGAQVANSSGWIGEFATASNNSVLVTGSGSTWSNSSDLFVGASGSGNSLVISNGGGVSVTGSSYGTVIGINPGSANNSLLVTGTNSFLSNSLSLYVGMGGSGNSMVISNGAHVVNVMGDIYSSGNSVLVTGVGSIWNNSGNLLVGDSGSGNSLVITNGGQVSDSVGYIGQNLFSMNNSVLVTGPGSTWSNNADLYVGLEGGGTLTIGSGGKVIASSVSIAYYAGSVGTVNFGTYGGSDTNVTLVTPSISFGNASSSTGILNFNQRDTATFTSSITGGGSLNQLGSGTTILTGSNSYTGTTTVNAGVLLVDNTTGWGVGSGLTVNSSGVVGGSGSIAGAALINGLLDPARGSSNAMTLTFNTNVTLGATATTMIDLLSAGSYDKIKVGGTLNYGGIFDIALSNTNAPGTYQFFSTLSGGTNITTTGSFSTVELTGLFGTWLMTNSSGTWNYANGTDSYNFSQAAGQLTVTAVPEPSTYALFGLSWLAALVVLRRNRMSE